MLDLHQILPRHPSIERYQLMAMEQLGIEWALLQSAPAQAPSLLGNDELAATASAHPGRFRTSWFVDPRHPDAVGELDRAVAHGARAIKLLPVTGWRADAPDLLPFFAEMAARDLVAMVHTGFFTARHKDEEAAAGRFMDSRLADPLFFDLPCRAVPDLVVILCHTGGAVFVEQAACMISQHDNVWGDVSGSGVFALQRLLRGIAIDWRKLFWGNDSPPYGYPLNLQLLLRTLSDAGAPELISPLLYDTGARFADAHLS
jgi:predicted TIM-barrel fold metal-dependent hydrolase